MATEKVIIDSSCSFVVFTGGESLQKLLNALMILAQRKELSLLRTVILVGESQEKLNLYPEFPPLDADYGVSFSFLSDLNHELSVDLFQSLEQHPQDFVIPLALDQSLSVSALRRVLSRTENSDIDGIVWLERNLPEPADLVVARPDWFLLPWLEMGGRIPSSNFAIRAQRLLSDWRESPSRFEYESSYKTLLATISEDRASVNFYDGADTSRLPENRWRQSPDHWSNPGGWTADEHADEGSSIKALIIGDLRDYHHLKIYFSSPLGHSSNHNIFFRMVDIRYVRNHDLLAGHTIVFARLFHFDFSNILETAARYQKTTVYMLDDNYLHFGTDFPDLYGGIFDPQGKINARITQAIDAVDSVLVFSPILAQDIRPINASVELLRPSVDIEKFDQIPRRHHQGFVIGFAGSLRFQDEAFQALARVAKSRDDVKVVLMGTLTPEQLQLFQGVEKDFAPYQSYEGYVRTIRNWSPDLMLAPLGNSRSESSKVINKYLEITAAGAAGIYSNVIPYSTCISHGSNGWLVDDFESVEAWESAIHEALNSDTISEVASNARADVVQNYSAESQSLALVEYLTRVSKIHPK